MRVFCVCEVTDMRVLCVCEVTDMRVLYEVLVVPALTTSMYIKKRKQII